MLNLLNSGYGPKDPITHNQLKLSWELHRLESAQWLAAGQAERHNNESLKQPLKKRHRLVKKDTINQINIIIEKCSYDEKD